MKKRAALYVLLFPRHTITRDRKDTEGVNGTNHLTSCRGETETGWPVWAQNSRRIHRKRAAAAAAMGRSWAPHPPKASTTSRPRSRASPDGAGGCHSPPRAEGPGEAGAQRTEPSQHLMTGQATDALALHSCFLKFTPLGQTPLRSRSRGAG